MRVKRRSELNEAHRGRRALFATLLVQLRFRKEVRVPNAPVREPDGIPQPKRADRRRRLRHNNLR